MSTDDDTLTHHDARALLRLTGIRRPEAERSYFADLLTGKTDADLLTIIERAAQLYSRVYRPRCLRSGSSGAPTGAKVIDVGIGAGANGLGHRGGLVVVGDEEASRPEHESASAR